MIFNKPNFWDKKNSILSILLFPISMIVLIIIYFKKKLIVPKKFNIPIICVGNIYLGGTGKTPTSIFIAKALKNSGCNPAILRKYYKSHSDEHHLIKKEFNDLVLCENRISGIKHSIKKKFDILILDDGYQDNSIIKDLNIVCFNSNQLIGNGMVIPSGPLRENLSSLKKTNIILINGEKKIEFENKIFKINQNIEIFYSNYKAVNINDFKNKKLFAIAGIGNPENFFELIKKNNLEIEKKLIFPDHYKFSKFEFQDIIQESKNKNLQIVMTEKDYFKIENFGFRDIKYLKVSLEIKNKEKFLGKINELYNKNN